MSWPERAGRVNLLDVLPAQSRFEAAEFESHLKLRRDELSARRASEGKARAYWDVTLKSDRAVYISFVKELLKRNMCKLHSAHVSSVGCFFVSKKSGKIRIIIDVRKTNRLLRPPPSTTLASTAAVAEFESEEEELHFSIQDIADCFYQFAIDGRLQKYFALMPVTAGEVGVQELEGKKVAYDRLIYPCLSVLPMGFSWALHWTQQAHRYLLELGGFGDSSSEMLDKHPPPTGQRQAGQTNLC